jgi:hypothetical protein
LIQTQVEIRDAFEKKLVDAQNQLLRIADNKALSEPDSSEYFRSMSVRLLTEIVKFLGTSVRYHGSGLLSKPPSALES